MCRYDSDDGERRRRTSQGHGYEGEETTWGCWHVNAEAGVTRLRQCTHRRIAHDAKAGACSVTGRLGQQGFLELVSETTTYAELTAVLAFGAHYYEPIYGTIP